MAFTKLIGRLSGLLTYSDGSSDSFAATIDDAGLVSVNDTVTGSVALRNAANGNTDFVYQLTHPFGNDLDIVGAADARTVTSFVGELSGRISNDNGTTADFIYQLAPGYGGAHAPDGGDNAVVISALSGEAGAFTGVLGTQIKALAAAIIGGGNVSWD